MDWFINRGDIVEENKPKQVMYRRVYRVEDERPSLVTVKIYACSDNDNTGPSIREDGRIPPDKIPKVTGADGLGYYEVAFFFEVTYYSGYTKYEFIHDNVNCGPVTAGSFCLNLQDKEHSHPKRMKIDVSSGLTKDLDTTEKTWITYLRHRRGVSKP
ncbi:MAG: hypothetical protein L6R42_006201 [Xanthoria sp. 1 TBL-2021]|nr:MAG: hypothetical protein L6R42_006201 [Xanthoria sp. 1 TBL-2021]